MRLFKMALSHIVGNASYVYKVAVSCLTGTEDSKSCFLISGSPRGGTTWLAEVVAKSIQSERILWEPLQDGNPEIFNVNFSKRPFVSEVNISEKQEIFFKNLMLGKQVNWHLLRLKKFPRNIVSFFKYKRTVIKFVRGNGVVGYLHKKYDLPKPLVIIRHPCAVVASQLNMGSWEDHPHVDSKLLEMYPSLLDKIDFNAPLHERLAMTWACDVLAAKASAENIYIVYYEDLITRGHEIISPILKEWGYEVPEETLSEILSQSSSTTHSWSSHEDEVKKLGRWKDQLDNTTIDSILCRVHAMGVDDYNNGFTPIARDNKVVHNSGPDVNL